MTLYKLMKIVEIKSILNSFPSVEMRTIYYVVSVGACTCIFWSQCSWDVSARPLLLNRTFKLPCQGIGVLPALELSESVINFAATAVNDTSSAAISVRNPRLSRLNSAVIRRAVMTQGQKMFEFVVPEDSHITICPKVAAVTLGEVGM